MKITRRGSSANHGDSEIELENYEIKYGNSTIHLQKSRIKDFNTDSTHDYTISLSMEELSNLIKFLGDKIPNKDPESISSAFSPCLREIIRIHNTCVGQVGVMEKKTITKNSKINRRPT